MIATAVAMDEENIMENNLKGTLKDKLNVENFCYNFKKYRLHPTIQLSEESAYKVKAKMGYNREFLNKEQNEKMNDLSVQLYKQSVPKMEGDQTKSYTKSDNLTFNEATRQRIETIRSSLLKPEELREDIVGNISDQRDPSCNYRCEGLKLPKREDPKIKYYDVNEETTDLIKGYLENKVLKKLMNFFNCCKANEHCILFLSGHGASTGECLFLNITVDAKLSFDDIVNCWNTRKSLYEDKLEKIESHLLIVVDACYLGKWAYKLENDAKFRMIHDISVQTSSTKDQTSGDAGGDSGGYFMNNLLYLNGMRDLVYITNYKKSDEITNKRVDSQTPTFFSRYQLLQKTFGLKIGFNSWEDMEWRVRTSFKGTFVGDNGEIIQGEFKSIQLHGEGIKKLSNGRVESGTFKNDKLNGIGKLTWNGITCEGTFSNGNLTRDYKAKLSDGNELPEITNFNSLSRQRMLEVEDDMIKEIRHLNESPFDIVKYNWVKTHYINSRIIEGEQRDGKKHGFNIEYEDNKIVRIGHWENDLLIHAINVTSEGLLSYSAYSLMDIALEKIAPGSMQSEKKKNDDMFDGEKEDKYLMPKLFKEDLWLYWNPIHGTRMYEKGEMTYQGDFVNQKPQGYGILEFKDGVKYEGFWNHGLPHGTGTYFNAKTGEGYCGFFENGLRHGKGRMIYKNKEIYEGSWYKDNALGWGKLEIPNKGTFDGFMLLSESEIRSEEKNNSQTNLICGYGKFTKDQNHEKLITQISLKKQMVGSSNKPEYGKINQELVNHQNLYGFSDRFEGGIWWGKRYGLCKYQTTSNEYQVAEFVWGMIYLRDRELKKSDSIYKGDMLYYMFKPDAITRDHLENDLKFNFIKKHGYGKYEETIGNTVEIYEGMFYIGSKAGPGELKIKKRIDLTDSQLERLSTNRMHTFLGEFYDDYLLKNVKLKFADKSFFSGFLLMKRNKLMTNEVNDIYMSNWIIPVKYGYGSHSGTSTGTYKGMFVKNKRHGMGCLTYKNTVYEGEFENNQKHGRGKFDDSGAGISYKGEFRHNKYHGDGTLTKNEAFEYIGNFKNGMYEGKGSEKNWEIETLSANLEHDEVNNESIAKFLFRGNYKVKCLLTEQTDNLIKIQLKVYKLNQTLSYDIKLSEEETDMTFNAVFEDNANYILGMKTDEETEDTQIYLSSNSRMPTIFRNYENLKMELKKNQNEGRWEVQLDSDEYIVIKAKRLIMDEVRVSLRKVNIDFLNYKTKLSNDSYLLCPFTYTNHERYLAFIEYNGSTYERLSLTRTLTESYAGEFSRGLRQGFGVYYGKNSEFYKGQFKNGRYDGKGLLRNKNRDQYSGQFKDGMKFNEGCLRYSSGDIYQGQFRNNEKNGKGYFKNVRYTYVGEYENDNKHGYGKLTCKDVFSYEGYFFNDHLNGYGSMKLKDEKVIKGYFNHNCCILDEQKVDFDDGSLYTGSAAFYSTDFLNVKSTEQQTTDWEYINAEKLDLSKYYIFDWDEVNSCKEYDSIFFRYLDGNGCLRLKGKREMEVKMSSGFIVIKSHIIYNEECQYKGYIANKIRREGIDRTKYTIDEDLEYHCKHGVGCQYSTSGLIFYGFFSDDNFYKGSILYQNGDMYHGQLVRNKRNGIGEMKYLNGDIYRGEFYNDDKHGSGVLKSCQFIYKGEFFEDKFNGMGKLKYYGYKKYEGSFLNGCKHGKGILVFANSDNYRGEFLNDKFHGYGVLSTNANAEIYSGSFENGRKEGHGVYMSKNFNYSGEFSNDLFNGHGVLVKEGTTYEGEFLNGYYHGVGTLTDKESVYKGYFSFGKKHGFGSIQVGPTIMSGMYQNNDVSGDGTFEITSNSSANFSVNLVNSKIQRQVKNLECNDSTVYTGDALVTTEKEKERSTVSLDDLIFHCKHGNGKLVFSDGYTYEGLFLDDMAVREITPKTYIPSENFEFEKISGRFFYLPIDLSSNEETNDDDKQMYRYYNNKIKEMEKRQKLTEEEEKDLKWMREELQFFAHFRPFKSLYKFAIDSNKSSIMSYKGSFKNGCWNGIGQLIFKNGDIMEGEFVNNCLEGYGKKVFADGSNYKGNFVKSRFNGYGVLTHSNGIVYSGEFKDDEMEGWGVMEVPKIETRDVIMVGSCLSFFEDNYKLKRDKMYTGICYYYVNKTIDVSKLKKFEDAFVCNNIYRNGRVYSKDSQLEQMSHLFGGKVKLKIKNLSDGSIEEFCSLSELEDTNQTYQLSYSNGTTLITMFLTYSFIIKILRFPDESWFAGEFDRKGRHGFGIYKTKEREKTKKKLLNQDQIVIEEIQKTPWLRFYRDEML